MNHPNKIVLTPAQIAYLKANVKYRTNKELADDLCIGITTLRNILYSLGLGRFKVEYWTKEAVEYLKQNYQFKGDAQLAREMQVLFPKNNLWTRKMIRKKRAIGLGLHRDENQLNTIEEMNREGLGSKLKEYWRKQRVRYEAGLPSVFDRINKTPRYANY